MIVDLPATTVSDVNKALVRPRSEGGVQALGRVLTLVIVTDEGNANERDRGGRLGQPRAPLPRDRARAAGSGRPRARLDAEIRVGADAGASDVIVLRGYGELAADDAGRGHGHAAAAAGRAGRGVVAGGRARGAVEGPVGELAQRRITDALSAKNPTKAFEQRRAHYVAGDTDLTWTRLTPWRALLATALDAPPHDPSPARWSRARWCRRRPT